jgi:tetratricopeptide (TPR) repeat protein
VPFYPLIGVANVLGGVASALALVGVTGVVAAQLRPRPYLAVGWLWYAGMLVPVIGIVQVGMQAYADRYTYLPVIGLQVAVIWWLGELWPRTRSAKVVAVAMSAIALAVLGVAAARQVALWKDSRTIFTRALVLDPANAVAHQCLGSDFLRNGNYRQAVPHFEAALRVIPSFTEPRVDLGIALSALGRYDEAVAQFQQALRTKDTPALRHNLGLTFARQGRMDKAIVEYENAMRLDPDDYASVVELAAALGANGRWVEAESRLRHALTLYPDDSKARRLLATTLTLEGRVEEAIGEYREILRRDPDDLDALNNVAWIRATHAEAGHRDGVEAVRFAERARDKSPEPVAVLYSTLAAAYAEAGRFTDAVQAGERAVALAKSSNEPEAAERYTLQLQSYRAGKPFHFSR